MGLYFLQIADRDVDRRSQIDYGNCVRFGWPVTQPDDFSTQRSTLQITDRMPAARLINRYIRYGKRPRRLRIADALRFTKSGRRS